MTAATAVLILASFVVLDLFKYWVSEVRRTAPHVLTTTPPHPRREGPLSMPRRLRRFSFRVYEARGGRRAAEHDAHVGDRRGISHRTTTSMSTSGRAVDQPHRFSFCPGGNGSQGAHRRPSHSLARCLSSTCAFVNETSSSIVVVSLSSRTRHNDAPVPSRFSARARRGCCRTTSRRCGTA